MARSKHFSREDALERAMQLFWQRGFEGTSMEDLVHAMGLSRSSIYDTFGGKQALYLAALDRYAEHRHRGIDELMAQDRPVRSLFRDFFDGAVRAFSSDPKRRGCFVTNAAAERVPADRATTDRVRASMRRLEQTFERTLARARRRGELPADRSPRRLARYLVNAFNGLRLSVRTTTDRNALRDMVDTTLSVLD